MRPKSLDADIDKLYQLRPEEFTAARNALAKQAGTDAGEIRRLQKPPLPAWAVNQLYWNNRDTYDALVESASALRSAHKAVLGGRRGDLRTASKAHDEALDRALKATLELVADAGYKVTDATRQAVLTTLRALPSPDSPGRLARTLQPGGFEMLSGIDVATAKRPVPASAKRSAPVPSGTNARTDGTRAARDDRNAVLKRRAAARDAVSEASRETREAETEFRRQEFTAARAAKEAEKAATRLEQAREALTAAEREVEEAEQAVKTADKMRERARRDAADAQVALDTARGRLERAQQALEEIAEAT